MNKKNILFIFLIFALKIGFSQQNNIDSLKNLLNQASINEKIITLIELSGEYWNINIDTSTLYAEEALSLAKESGNKELLSKAYKNIANIYTGIAWKNYSSGFYRKSDENFNKALSIHKQLNDTLWIAKTYYALALCNKYWGQYRKAVKYAQFGYDNYEKINSKDGIADIYLVLGYIYVAWNNHKQSKYYFDKAIKLLSELDKDKSLGFAFLGKGNVFFAFSETDSAFIYYNKALKIFEKTGQTYGIALCLRDIGKYYLHKGNFKESKLVFNKSLKLLEQIKSKRGISELLILKGKYFFKKGDYINAVKFFNSGQELAISMELHENIIKNYKYISEAYELLNDKNNALKYYKRYSFLKDSVFSAEKFEQITEMQTKYETEKKEQENIILRKEIEIKEVKEQKHKIFLKFLYILSSALFLLIVLLFIMFRMKANSLKKTRIIYKKEKQLAELAIKNKENENKALIAEKKREEAENLMLQEELKAEQEINLLEKEKHEADILHKNQELTTLTVQFINKNETLGKIKRILVTESIKTAPNYKTCNNKLVSIINSNIDNDIDWKNFKISFNEVHAGFIERLLDKHPELTLNEQKLCAYLRINLTSNEIAQIMNISTGSIGKNRQRLRKKLEINQQLELKEYIQAI
ncbi:MAG: tetratricopeptide repeat protein [Bacteroidales bacterium]|nr:tetratricopeptide repeat protein [Bacteroidales bacterium]